MHLVFLKDFMWFFANKINCIMLLKNNVEQINLGKRRRICQSWQGNKNENILHFNTTISSFILSAAAQLKTHISYKTLFISRIAPIKRMFTIIMYVIVFQVPRKCMYYIRFLKLLAI